MTAPTQRSEECLMAHLRQVAVVARRKTASIAVAVYSAKGEHVDDREFQCYSETAAFLAFDELGGDRDDPDAFDWDGLRTELLARTQKGLRKLLRSSDQNDDEERNRSRRRIERAPVEEYQWDGWTQGTGDPAIDAARSHTGECLPEQERVLQEQELQALGEALAGVLSASDVDLLTKHYFEGKSQRELAAEEAGLREGEVDPKAENRINMRISRARKRAAERLPDFWRAVLK